MSLWRFEAIDRARVRWRAQPPAGRRLLALGLAGIGLDTVLIIWLSCPSEQRIVVKAALIVLALSAGLAGFELIRQLLRRAAHLEAQNAELTAARAALERAYSNKSMMLATLAHELRAPLTVVIGTLQYVQLDGPAHRDQGLAQMVARANAASKQLIAMIDDILDWSKLAAGKAVMCRQEVDVRKLLSETRSAIEVIGHGKGLRIAMTAAADVPALVRTDPIRLRQIVFNLLSNAVKFTDQGLVTLRVWMRDLATLQIQVSDTGVGIHAAQLEEVWEPFVQGQASANGSSASAVRQRGTGLGLPIVRQLVALLGGSVALDSVPGQGTTVTMTLPIDQ